MIAGQVRHSHDTAGFQQLLADRRTYGPGGSRYNRNMPGQSQVFIIAELGMLEASVLHVKKIRL